MPLLLIIFAFMARKTTPTADKLLTIISDMRNIQKDYILEDSTFESLGISNSEKGRILNRVAERFNMQILECEIFNIKTVYNALQFVEGSKNFKTV